MQQGNKKKKKLRISLYRERRNCESNEWGKGKGNRGKKAERIIRSLIILILEKFGETYITKKKKKETKGNREEEGDSQLGGKARR